MTYSLQLSWLSLGVSVTRESSIILCENQETKQDGTSEMTSATTVIMLTGIWDSDKTISGIWDQAPPPPMGPPYCRLKFTN